MMIGPLPVFAAEEPSETSFSNYGGVGLMDTRSARFLPDGYLSFGAFAHRPDDRFAAVFELLPWAELTFRYSINRAFEPRDGQALYDRSFDVKFRLVSEGEYRPALAIGLQDFIGTGVYSGEFLVGSKQVGPFDISVGLGWGRLGSRGTFANPLGVFGSAFKTRPAPDANPGGQLRFGYFRGSDAGLFGGVTYTTPLRGLKLEIEYSSDTYEQERQVGGGDYGFPVNVGVSYSPYPWLNVGVSLMHGRNIGVRVSAAFDPAAENYPARLNPPPRFRARDDEVVNALARRAMTQQDGASSPQTRFVDLTRSDGAESPAPEAPTPDEAAAPVVASAEPNVADAIRAAVSAQRLTVLAVAVEQDRVRVEIENRRYRRDTEAVARAARALSTAAPAEIDFFEVTTMRNGQPLATVVLPRREIDALAQNAGSPAELWYASTVSPAPAAPPVELPPSAYPRFSADIFPVFRQSLFDPNNPFYFKVGIGGAVQAQLARGLLLEGFASASLYDNFSDIKRPSDSVLPHVRTDIAQYLKQGKYGVEVLTASYYFKLAPTLFGRAGAGLLEQMFAGLGGEILYRPFGRRWAIGADLWDVRQRGFDELFDLQPYETLTGHVSAYYRTPWHDIDLGIHAGRYLAGDYGVTFEASRRFSTGVQVGAWFTLTNVSAAQFGEGSFDKGIRLVIPLEWVAPFATQNGFTLEVRPIQRDGGQRLVGAERLYEMTDPSDYGALSEQWSSVFKR